MLKTSAYGLDFQHLPRDLANVNAWKTMSDPYIESTLIQRHNVESTSSQYWYDIVRPVDIQCLVEHLYNF